MRILESFIRGVGPEDACSAAVLVAVKKGRHLFRVSGTALNFIIDHSEVGEVLNVPVSGSSDNTIEVPEGILRVTVNTHEETASAAEVNMWEL